MNRRAFSISAASVAATMPTWSQTSAWSFCALGACAALDAAAGIKAAGGEYIEESVQRFLIPSRPDSEWAINLERAKACPLPTPVCNGFLPGTLKSTGPAADHEGILEYSEIAFKRARQMGVEIIVFGSGGSRRLPEGFPSEEAAMQFVSLLKQMGPLAQAHGITIAIEPLRRQECNFINTVLEGGAIAKEADHPNIRLMCDLYHMLQNGEDPASLQQVGGLLVHSHIAEKKTRSAPGVAGDDFRPFFAALKTVNYKARISIEGQWKIEDLPKAYEVIRRHACEA